MKSRKVTMLKWSSNTRSASIPMRIYKTVCNDFTKRAWMSLGRKISSMSKKIMPRNFSLLTREPHARKPSNNWTIPSATSNSIPTMILPLWMCITRNCLLKTERSWSRLSNSFKNIESYIRKRTNSSAICLSNY